MSSNSISIKNISKCFHIYENPINRLKQFFLPRVTKLIFQKHTSFYKEFWALKNISFQISRGETLGIIGKNGSGKSTLLQIICGTLAPTFGEVEICGRVAALLELGSGFNPEFTGRENIYMNASILGATKDEIDSRYDDIVSFADIGEFIDQPVKTYSSGMYVRLAFSVAINVDPDVLIIDEALAVGDIRFQSKCLRKINEIKKTGCTVIFVSHSSGHIEALCDKVIWLNDGEIKGIGAPAELMRAYMNYMVHGLDESVEFIAGDNNKYKDAIMEDTSVWRNSEHAKNIRKEGRVELKKFRVSFDKEESPAQIFSAPYEFSFEAIFSFGQNIFQPLIAFGIFNSLNEPIIHFNSYNTKRTLQSLSDGDDYHFAFNLTLPALKPGEYLLSIGVDDGVPSSSHVLLHIYDLFVFNVKLSPSAIMQAGYIQMVDVNFQLDRA